MLIQFPTQKWPKQIAIDWSDLELAFRDTTEVSNYIDRMSGEIITILPGFHDEAELEKQLVESPGRYVQIHPIGATFARKVMTEFTAQLKPCSLRDRLRGALPGSGSYTRCLAILRTDEEMLGTYYRFEQSQFWNHVEFTLRRYQIESATAVPTVDLFEGRITV